MRMAARATLATLDKALADAPAGRSAGRPRLLRAPGGQRKAPLTLVARATAVDDNREPIKPGRTSVIEPQTFSAPGAGTWTKVTLTGPATGQQYTVWKWAGSPVNDATPPDGRDRPGAVPQPIAHLGAQERRGERLHPGDPGGLGRGALSQRDV